MAAPRLTAGTAYWDHEWLSWLSFSGSPSSLVVYNAILHSRMRREALQWHKEMKTHRAAKAVDRLARSSSSSLTSSRAFALEGGSADAEFALRL